MNDTTMTMTAPIPSGLGMPTCGHDLGAFSGRVVPSGTPGTSVTGTDVTGTDVRDRQGVVFGFIVETSAHQAFPGSPAWRPPIT